MSRIFLIALLAVVGALAMVGTAGADVGDIDAVDVEDAGSQPFESTDDEVTVEGFINCETDEKNYGIVITVTEERRGVNEAEDNFIFTNSATDDDSAPQGVGAYGPNTEAFGDGVVDDQPCDETSQNWDVTVRRSDGSPEFNSAALNGYDVAGVAGTEGDGDADEDSGTIFVDDLEFFSADSVAIG